jgi:hypothetical protein
MVLTLDPNGPSLMKRREQRRFGSQTWSFQMAARPVTVSAPVAKRTAAAPKNTAKAATRKSALLPEGTDESADDITFDDAPAAPAKRTAPKATAKPATTSKPAAKKGGSRTITFVLEKETPGAGQYCEVDSDGKKLGIKEACMGKPYLRKDQVGGVLPKKFTAIIEW